jgi:hypothetical protein
MDSIGLFIIFFLAVGLACFFLVRGIRQQPPTSFWYPARKWLPIVLILFVIGFSGLNLFRYPSSIEVASKFARAYSTQTLYSELSNVCAEDRHHFLDVLSERVYYSPFLLTNIKGHVSSANLNDTVVLITGERNFEPGYSTEVHLRYYGIFGWCIHLTY